MADIVRSIASLAWPTAVFGAAWLFREKLTALMPLLRLKYKDLDVSFRLDKAEHEAQELPPAPPEPAPTPEEQTRFEQVAEVSPRAAILELRYELEDAVRRVFEAHAEYQGKRSALPISSAIRILRNADIIDQKTSALLSDLRAIGNQAAHSSGAEFSKSDAIRYQALVNEVLPILNRAAEASPGTNPNENSP